MECRYIITCLFVTLLIPGSIGLRCSPCETRVHLCQTAESLDCKFGVGKDVCNCCPACLKGKKENCGGVWNTYGHCAVDLQCIEDEGANHGICRPRSGKASGKN